MKMKTCIAALLLLCMQGRLNAQTASPLKMGETCPDMVLHFVNGSKPVPLSYYKGKMVILDFFSVICGACIRELPRLNELQKTEGGSIQIIIVSEEPLQQVQAFFKTNKIAAANTLPVVVANKQLSRLFPHRLLPHEVWIDATGQVRAITHADEVTASNITSIMQDKKFTLPQKQDLLDFDASMPLLENGNGGSIDQVFFRSTLSSYIEGVGSKTAIYTNSNCKRYLALNKPLLSFYEEAFEGAVLPNHIITETKDPAVFNIGESSQTDKLYCYELITPVTATVNEIHNWMKQDIERCFGITGKFETRKVHCYALVRTANSDTGLKSKTDSAYTQFSDDDPIKKIMHEPLAVLVDALNNAASFSSPVFIDKTGYSNAVDMTLLIRNVNDIPALQEALAPYGLALAEDTAEMKMFVITDALPQQATDTSSFF